MTIGEFLAARLAEDASRAWIIHDVERCDAMLYEENMVAYARREPDCDCGWPARILNEVAIKRSLLEMCARLDEIWSGNGAADAPVRAVSGAVRNAMAAFWNYHPDYNPDWVPS
jgi:Family of unknown function (DUF6221)